MMMRIRGVPLLLPLLLVLLASLLGISSAFLLPGPARSAAIGRAVGGSGSLIWGRGAAVGPVLGKKDDADEELSAEFARRLEEEDDDAPAPVKGRRRPPPPPQGAGTPQVAQRSFMTMPQTKSFNRESGTDYWMDEKDMKKEQQKKVKRKAPSPDQFPKERIREEIVSPYKNNWILFIAITIFSIAFFAYLFPEELQIPSITIPDFETGAPIPESLK